MMWIKRRRLCRPLSGCCKEALARQPLCIVGFFVAGHTTEQGLARWSDEEMSGGRATPPQERHVARKAHGVPPVLMNFSRSVAGERGFVFSGSSDFPFESGATVVAFAEFRPEPVV